MNNNEPEKAKHESVLDTGSEQLGKIYAKALVAAAQSADATDVVVEELGGIVDDLLGESRELRLVIGSPRIDAAEKIRVLERLLADQVHPVLMRFLKVAAERNRLAYLADIRRAAETLRDLQQGRVVAEVRSAVPLSDDLRGRIASQIGQTVGREVRVQEKVDPSLIGGIVVRVGDTVYDASVAGRLKRLADNARAGFAKQLSERAEAFAEAS